jgi:hypothetical protein
MAAKGSTDFPPTAGRKSTLFISGGAGETGDPRSVGDIGDVRRESAPTFVFAARTA